MAIAAKARGNIHKGLIAATKHLGAQVGPVSGGKDASRSARRRVVTYEPDSKQGPDSVKTRQDEQNQIQHDSLEMLHQITTREHH